MQAKRLVATAIAALLVSACGGGGGGGDPTPTPTATTSPPPTVTLSATSAVVRISEGETASLGFDVAVGGLAGRPAFGDVRIDDSRVRLDQSSGHGSANIQVRLETVDFPAGGRTQSNVTFRLCEDASCNNVYPGTTRTFAVDLTVTLEDWAMFQRNAAHTGYVAASYNPADFATLWEWSALEGSQPRAVSAEAGTIYVSEGEDFEPGLDPNDRLTAFNSTTGAIRWQRDMDNNHDISGPTLGDGKLYLTIIGRSNINTLALVDSQTGAVTATNTFASQLETYPQPTLFENQVFVAAGYYGGEVYAFNATSGAKQWQMFGTSGVTGGQAVAADANYVYYYDGPALTLFNRSTGAIVRSLDNPFDANSGAYAWHSAMILDGEGGAFGFGQKRTWPYIGKTLVRFDVEGGTGPRWNTGLQYFAHPALADSRIYALNETGRVIHAIDTATGEIKDGLPVPGTSALRYNVVATPNLLFASTLTDVYAIDRATRATVWTAPTGGMLAITPDNLLVVAGENRVTVYKLF